MRTDFFYASAGVGNIRAGQWLPEGEPIGIIQIVHGIAEHIERYDAFAQYLTGLGYLVVAEDHMGHGRSVDRGGIRGYFHGGWFSAVEDTCALIQQTRSAYPQLPYVLLGHSMGSFMARTILCLQPECGISAAVIVGTGWQPRQILSAAVGLCSAACKAVGETKPSPALQSLVFGSYNKKVEHPQTSFDWLTRDRKIVSDYVSDPDCGFTPTAGLLRDMMKGMRYIEDTKNLAHMRKDLPVLFISGGDDPVGSYGKGVLQAAEAFRKAGMKAVKCRLYPLGRHEILNEINRDEVFRDISSWISEKLAL